MSYSLRGLAIRIAPLLLVAAIMACGGGGEDGGDATTAEIEGDTVTTQQVSLTSDVSSDSDTTAAHDDSSVADGEHSATETGLPCFTLDDPNSVVASIANEDDGDSDDE